MFLEQREGSVDSDRNAADTSSIALDLKTKTKSQHSILIARPLPRGEQHGNLITEYVP